MILQSKINYERASVHTITYAQRKHNCKLITIALLRVISYDRLCRIMMLRSLRIIFNYDRASVHTITYAQRIHNCKLITIALLRVISYDRLRQIMMLRSLEIKI